MAKGKLFTPKADVILEIDGTPVMLRKDLDRIREGHPLLEGRANLFQTVEDGVTHDVEAATSAPGEKRGDPAPTTDPTPAPAAEKAPAAKGAGKG